MSPTASRQIRRKLLVGGLLCLAALPPIADAAESAGLRKRGARLRKASASVPADSHYDSVTTGAYVTTDDFAPMPALNITPPDTAVWSGGYGEPYAASGEGTADFLDYHEYLAGAGAPVAVASVPYQEPVPYESPMPTMPTPTTMPMPTPVQAQPPAEPVVSAVREDNAPPAAKRGLRLRRKRSSGEESAEASSRAAVVGATSAADPYVTYAPPMPLPSVPVTPSSVPSAPAYDWAESDGMDIDVLVPSAIEARAEAEDSRLLDKYSDNTTAKRQDQEKENTNYDQDGNASGSSRTKRDREKVDAPARTKSPQPERIHSSPPTKKVDIFSPDALAYEAAQPQTMQPPPTRMEVEDYRRRLEMRLLERYNNIPEHAGKVGRVTVVLSKPLQLSLDGNMIRAEFDQLVFDPWGKRIPELEEEYYVVTFGSGGAQQVRSDPSIRVGLDLEKTYSERAPLTADPFARVPSAKSFKPAPAPAAEVSKVKMPDWWRPDFPELR